MIRRYYSGVQRGDEIINVRDSVLLKSGTRKKDPPFVARVSGLWEEDEGKPVALQLLWSAGRQRTLIKKVTILPVMWEKKERKNVLSYYCISYKCKFVFICQTNGGNWC